MVFQSTPPARGATLVCTITGMSQRQFQSTPPARGATVITTVLLFSASISIHAPREGGDGAFTDFSPVKCISIHAPREGGDSGPVNAVSRLSRFQSTPPARGATSALISLRPLTEISIHAPREGGDG